jgi:hypothetical protein
VLTRALVECSANNNILTPTVCTNMQIFEIGLLLTRSFHDALSRRLQPLDCVDLPITFGMVDNFHIETFTFDVVDINLPCNAIIGRPVITKFMVIPHYA